MNHPIDIAQSLKWLIDKYDSENGISLSDLEDALYNLKAIADNKYNFDYWRSIYKALSVISEIPELAGLPF